MIMKLYHPCYNKKNGYIVNKVRTYDSSSKTVKIHIYRFRGSLKKRNRQLSYPRFIMECHLGRMLLKCERVYHKDKNSDNNYITNLYLKTKVIKINRESVQ